MAMTNRNIEETLRETEIPDKSRVELNVHSEEDAIVADLNQQFAMKQRLYEQVLAPQLKENEDLKREHKGVLMTNIFKILKWQFIFTYIFVFTIIIAVLFSSYLGITEKLAMEGISFIKFYITSIIVELISILFFIVKNVFDKSITSLTPILN